MKETRSKVRALHLSGLDPDMVVELIIDVVSRGLGKLGGRPAKGTEPAQSAASQTPVDVSIKVDVPEPVIKPTETSAVTSLCLRSESSLALFSPDLSEESSLDRRSYEPLPVGFGDFWALYPRKRGKQTAVKAWQTAAKDKALPPLETLMAALAWHVEEWNRLGTPDDRIPHPATWINGRRWEDERPSPRRATEKDYRVMGSIERFDERLQGESDAKRQGR